MTFAQRQRKDLERAIRASYRKHRSIRAAASELGIPFQTFYDRARDLGLKTSRKAQRRRA